MRSSGTFKSDLQKYKYKFFWNEFLFYNSEENFENRKHDAQIPFKSTEINVYWPQSSNGRLFKNHGVLLVNR